MNADPGLKKSIDLLMTSYLLRPLCKCLSYYRRKILGFAGGQVGFNLPNHLRTNSPHSPPTWGLFIGKEILLRGVAWLDEAELFLE